MEDEVLLCESNFCRLCGEKNENGVYIFSKDEHSTNLENLINKYLPITVDIHQNFPKYICPGCHIQLESTKLFLDLIVVGQAKLRAILQKQQDLQNSVTLELNCNDPFYTRDHTLRLNAEGLDKPRRKRGRPAKKLVDNEEKTQSEGKIEETKNSKEIEDMETENRRKRIVRAPVRFQGVVQGKELEDILKKEGVIDEENRIIEIDKEDVRKTSRQVVIGRTEGKSGEDLGRPVFINRVRSKPKSVLFKRAGMGNFECKICLKKFIHKVHYNFHLRSHEDEGLNVKSLENENLENPPVTEQENTVDFSDVINNESPPEIQDSQKNNKQHMCKKCTESFSTLEELKTHLQRHGSKKYICDICGKVLQHNSSLLYHKQTEHTNKKFVCNTCDKSFKHQQLLQRHQVVHSEARPYICPICNSSFKTKANLINHEGVHTGEKRYECTECNQKFAHKTSFSLHQRWHEGKKPYTCEYCNKKFSQNGNLLEHKRIHTGEKPFFCEVCGRHFTTSSQLKVHVKRHTGEKPWQCDVCDKSFLHKDSYIYHMRRHFNERPNVCKLCNRSFTEPWGLKKHMRIHTGEKPFNCFFCNKSFSDKSNRDKHTRTHLRFQNKNISITSNKDLSSIEEKKNSLNDLQLTQLVDQQGNPISIITQDGQTVPVVTSGNDADSNLHGLLPDGSLVPIEIAVQDKELEAELAQGTPLNILQTVEPESVPIQKVLQPKDIVQQLNPNFQLITNNEEDQVCWITYSIEDEDNLSQELVLESALVNN
ncbi:zinc finger protein 271-like [Diorhabda carinulata]|uniref:zinc finger protein 271-like n=1 Tax=Diorhabda carinulata TaxID=1163345 RepID=UPI0025A12A4E|nr:zinc finger protein 271-like [Diorhabda carinulata]